MKILVIGASGYIGSHVAAVFADAGHGVSALHRPGGAPPPARYSRVAGDLAEPGSLTAAATGYDRVIHAGAAIDDSTDRAGGWVIRPGMVYGDDGGLVPGLLTTKAVERGTGVYIGPPGTRWPVVHVDDLAALYLAVATRAAPGTIWHGASETVRLDAIATALGGGTAASWPVSEASTELVLLADLFTRDQDVSAAKTRAALGWAPAWTSIVKYLTA